MGNVGFTAAAALTIVGLGGVEVSAADQIDLVLTEIGRKSFGEAVYARQAECSCQSEGRAVSNRPGMALQRLAGLIIERSEQAFVLDQVLSGDYIVIH